MSGEETRKGREPEHEHEGPFFPKGQSRRKERGYHPVSGREDEAGDRTEPDRSSLGDGTRPTPPPGQGGGGGHR